MTTLKTEFSIDENTRNKSRELIENALLKVYDAFCLNSPNDMATEIEEQIYLAHAHDYRNSVRARLSALRNEEIPVGRNLLAGELSAAEFAHMDGHDLISPARQRKDSILEEQELRAHITRPIEVDIRAVADGRTREKWGVGSSAAAVDEF